MRRLIYFVVLLLLLVPQLTFASGTKATLKAYLDPRSSLRSTAVVTLSADGHRKSYRLPFSKTLKPGKYELYAWAENYPAVHKVFRLKPGQTLRLPIRLYRVDEDNPDWRTPAYFHLFPHRDTNFEINAEFTEPTDMTKPSTIRIKRLVILPYLAMARDITMSDIKKMKTQYIAEAKRWLKKNKVPSSIPIKIDSLF